MEIPGRIQIERFIPVEFFRKKVIPFEVSPFSRFYRNDRSFLYHLFGLIVPGFMSRESEKFTGILLMVQLNPVLVFGAKKIPAPFGNNFFTEISVQMVSAPGVWGLNPRSPARQTGAYPIELRIRIQCPFLIQRR